MRTKKLFFPIFHATFILKNGKTSMYIMIFAHKALKLRKFRFFVYRVKNIGDFMTEGVRIIIFLQESSSAKG